MYFVIIIISIRNNPGLLLDAKVIGQMIVKYLEGAKLAWYRFITKERKLCLRSHWRTLVDRLISGVVSQHHQC